MRRAGVVLAVLAVAGCAVMPEQPEATGGIKTLPPGHYRITTPGHPPVMTTFDVETNGFMRLVRAPTQSGRPALEVQVGADGHPSFSAPVADLGDGEYEIDVAASDNATRRGAKPVLDVYRCGILQFRTSPGAGQPAGDIRIDWLKGEVGGTVTNATTGVKFGVKTDEGTNLVVETERIGG